MTARAYPIVCFSYLAAAQLWRVQQFPTANSGAPIMEAEDSIAADAPMAAAVLSALDVPTLLMANAVGTDQPGQQVRAWLHRHAVATHDSLSTPSITVVVDGAPTRTWSLICPV
ncbi:hypothetical protein ACW2Q0_29150 [Nocardia sp. R16R-3T]